MQNKIDYNVTVAELACVVTANNRGHAARLAFRKMLRLGWLNNQPRSQRDAAWAGVQIEPRRGADAWNVSRLAKPQQRGERQWLRKKAA
jgi:hypothetical protein